MQDGCEYFLLAFITISMSNQLRLTLAFGAAVMGMLTINPPSIAQNYGEGYGFNNGVKNGYGPPPAETMPRSWPGYTFPNNYQPGLDRNLRYAPGSCSTYVNC